MVRFEFTLTDFDAEFLFDILQRSIGADHLAIMEQIPLETEESQRMIAYLEQRISDVEEMKAKMANTRANKGESMDREQLIKCIDAITFDLSDWSAEDVFLYLAHHDADMQQWESQICEVMSDDRVAYEQMRVKVLIAGILLEKGM